MSPVGQTFLSVLSLVCNELHATYVPSGCNFQLAGV
jgi:hypothetical protein